MGGVRHIAVIISAIAWFGIGAGWYTVFALPWAAGIGKTVDQIHQEAGGSPMPMVTGFLAILVMCYVLGWLISHLGEVTLMGGAKMGAIIAIGIVGAMLALNYGFEIRGFTLWLINEGYALVGMVLAGAIIGAWPKKKV